MIPFRKAFIALALIALLVGVVVAQTAGGSNWLYGWSDASRKPIWFKIGPSFVIDANGVLEVKPATPPPSVPTRAYGVTLAYDPAVSGWRLPVAAKRNFAVWVNGLRYAPGVDYVIKDGVVAALGSNMLPEFVVIVDYDE